jgi:glycosyltransferase involved in cell wall biosynthesis
LNASSRIGHADADIVVVAKGGRDFRFERMSRGEETPREFFYGFFDLETAGLSAVMIANSGAVPGVLGYIADKLERGFSSLTMLGVRPLSARLSLRSIRDAKVVISYTDGFSLSVGLGLPRRRNRPILMGGFHGLSDIEARVPSIAQKLVHRLIRRSLASLDHVFFFGEADRKVAIEHYGLAPDRSSVILFGVDTEFWRPVSVDSIGDYVFAVGQDKNRDFDCLAAASGEHPTRIVTRQKVRVPDGFTHVSITAGDFFGSQSLTDENLRLIYNTARAVVVPLKDVWQPTGYSVAPQAMSCGRPVIISKNRGFWAPDLLRDNENCLLVPPGDREALGAAIARIRDNPALAARLGRVARETVLTHFSLRKIGEGTIALAKLGLSMHDDKVQRSLEAV